MDGRCVRRISLHDGDEVGDAIQLLDRDRHVAADRKSLLRQGQAERSALGAPRAKRQSFSRRWHVGDIPGVGKVMEQKLHAIGIQKVGRPGAPRRPRSGTIALENGAWRWQGNRAAKTPVDGSTHAVGENVDPKSISHEHTFDEDTGDAERLQSTLMRLSEMVGRRLREGGYFARTLQLKLRYKDFTTITRAHSLEQPTQMDQPNFRAGAASVLRQLEAGRAGALAGSASVEFRIESQPTSSICWNRREAQAALAEGAGCRGSSARQVRRISHRPGRGMKGGFRERVHENPVGAAGESVGKRSSQEFRFTTESGGQGNGRMRSPGVLCLSLNSWSTTACARIRTSLRNIFANVFVARSGQLVGVAIENHFAVAQNQKAHGHFAALAFGQMAPSCWSSVELVVAMVKASCRRCVTRSALVL